MGKKSGKTPNKRESNGRHHDSIEEDNGFDDLMSPTAFDEDLPPNNGAKGGVGGGGMATIDDDLQSRIDEMNTTFIKVSSFDLGEAADMLIEKKINMREPGLTSIITHLRSSGTSSEELANVSNYLETLITRLSRMIRRPASPKEGSLVCTVLALLALYIGPHDETLLKSAERPLLQLIDRNDDDTLQELRCQALFTYSFLIYLYENEEKSVEILDYLQQIMTGESSDMNMSKEEGGIVTYTSAMKAKAIDCWVLLASHLAENDVLERVREAEVFETITTLMENASNDVSMKVSAGRAIAFLWEIAHKSKESLSFEELGHLLCRNPRIVEDALELIRKIAVDSSKKVSKKNKKEQRAEFRDIESFLLHQDFPVELIRMQGAEIEVSSFAKQRVIESLRQVLESGFHSSLRMYPVVKDILEVEFLTDDMDGAGTTSKVQKGSAKEKLRTKNMKQDRRYREAFISSEGYEDDD